MTQQEFFKRFTYSVSTDRIGGGGFGTVYKAKDHVLHRTVAIKVSEVKTTADGQKTFSLKDEFEALNHVPKHPNIANYEEFYSFEMPNGVFDYAVMQYYPDGNLSNAIKQGLTAKQKEDIATQLLEGIAFLHEHKVVHRDLKPGNVLIVRDGENMIPLITDFGLSKAASMDDGSVFSNSFGGGTQRYSSPEQLQGKPLRLNTDLWSFGAILYEIFTGDQLFSAGSGAANTAQADLEIYNKIIHGDVSNLGKMPEKWRKVAERCLVVDADKRAKDEKELFRIISGEAQEDETVTETVSSSDGEGTIADDKPSTKDPHSGLDPLSPTPTDKPKSRKGLWVCIAAVVVAFIAVVLFLRNPKAENALVNADSETGVLLHHVFENDTWEPYDYVEGNILEIDEPTTFDIDMNVCCTDDYPYDDFSVIFSVYDSDGNPYRSKVYKYNLKDKQGRWSVSKTNDVYTFVFPINKGMLISETGKYQFRIEQKRGTALVGIRELELINVGGSTGNLLDENKQNDEVVNNDNTANDHEYIDLGLPSGTLWATCNIGASKPEDYGNYYAWGEIQTKNTYNWETYKYANGDYNKLTKYCNNSDYGDNGFTDKLTSLQSNDDPATANWGSGWQTPSKAQWGELLNNTTNIWTTQNGVKGRLFTSKKNGQTIFLPAAGGLWDREFYHTESEGRYWSLQQYTNGEDASWHLYFVSDDCKMCYFSRCWGFSVRPVREK